MSEETSKKQNTEDAQKEKQKGGANTDTPSKTMAVNRENLLVAAVAVLVIMSGIQVFQIQSLVSAVQSGKINAGPAQGGAVGLPSQVGGCG